MLPHKLCNNNKPIKACKIRARHYAPAYQQEPNKSPRNGTIRRQPQNTRRNTCKCIFTEIEISRGVHNKKINISDNKQG